MKFILLVLLFVSFSVSAQQDDTLFVRYDSHERDEVHYITDTLFRSTSLQPLLLFETSWIPNTKSQLSAMGFGLYPSKVYAVCSVEGIESGENELVSLQKTDSTISLIYKVLANCCYSFLCDMEIVDSNTLNLKYIDYGNICGCTCFHTLSFELSVEDYDKEFLANFQKLKFVTLNGELKTKFE